MSEALQKWAGRPEQQELLLLNAQLRVAVGDIEGALHILSQVPSLEGAPSNRRLPTSIEAALSTRGSLAVSSHAAHLQSSLRFTND